MTKSSFLLGAALSAAWIASAARAAPESGPSTDAREARELGDALFAQGQFQEALHKYQVAWVLERAPLDLFRIGRCRYRLGEIRAAKDVLFRFLQLDPTSEHAPEAFDIISEIESAEARIRPAPEVVVEFDSVPPGASVEVENQVLCRSTPCSAPVPQGQYLVAMQKEGYDSTVGAFYAKSGARVILTLRRLDELSSAVEKPIAPLQPARPKAPADATSSAPAPSLKPLGLAGVSLGTAALVTGGILKLLSNGKVNDIRNGTLSTGADIQAAADAARRQSTFAVGLLIGGAAIAGIGIVMVVMGSDR